MSRVLYVYVGAPKAGSSWIASGLVASPHVALAAGKDVYFFDRHHQRGLGWYRAQFKPRSAPIWADISHDYLYDTAALRRIRDSADELGATLRIHAVLRNPLGRFLSAVQYEVRNGRVPERSRIALECEFPKLARHSMYASPVHDLLETFGPPGRSLRIDIFEEFFEDSEASWRSLVEWVGVPDAPVAPLERKRQASRPRSRRMARATKLTANWARRTGGQRIVNRLKANGLVERLLYTPMETNERVRDFANERTDPLVEYFADDVADLGRTLGRDLGSLWRDFQ